MTVTQNPATGWKEKADRARQLVEEVKSLNLEGGDDSGINSGELAQEARAKLIEATKLADEAKTERKSAAVPSINELMERFELTNADGDSQMYASGTGVVSGQSSASTLKTKASDSIFVDEGNPIKADSPLAAKSRLVLSQKARRDMDAKALAEGTTTTGGFLVPPQWMQELFAETRRQGNALRRYGWLNVHPVTDTNQVLLPKGSGSATVGWVAENAAKPSADQAFAQVAVNIFTAAGISKLSKQLVDDSSPTATDVATRELASLMGVLEEQAAINGTGTGQPRGILNTTGVNAVALATNTAVATLDALLDAIVAIQTSYFGAPNGALVSPRRLAFLQKAKDGGGQYLLAAPGTRGPNGGSGLLATQAPIEILGIPIGVSTNIPTNLGVGTNQDAIIVGDWNEAHWFQRQDMTLDSSDVAGTAFEQNQVWFRLEERVGFTAERFPQAFAVISGAGLVP